MHSKDATSPGKFVGMAVTAVIFATAGCGGGARMTTQTPPSPYANRTEHAWGVDTSLSF